MAGVTVRSGVMIFAEPDGAGAKRVQNTPLRVLVIGNFAGSGSVGQPLASRKHLRIDKDTFDEVFARLRVSLTLPFGDDAILFENFDDLHPDHLYENIGLFTRYQTLKKQLRSPDQFSRALAVLQEEGLVAGSVDNATSSQPVEAEKQGLLESLLSGAATADPSASAVEQLIRQTIAPYLQPQQHPKTEEYLQAVDLAVNQVMRQVMHTGDFQKLEASWRSLDLLQRRLDLDRACQLSLLNVSEAELSADFAQAQGDILLTDLLKNISGNRMHGNPGYDVLLIDKVIGNAEDSRILEMAMDLAAQINAVVLAGACSGAAGYEDFSLAEQAMSQELVERWNLLRKHPVASRTYAAGPRYLIRLPYGQKTASTDQFPYEELPEQGAHPYYLWGNGAYLLLLALVDGFTGNGSGRHVGAFTVENMPLHAYLDEEGDSALKPCAEFYLAEAAVNRLEKAGFTVLQSVQNTNSILIARWNALQSAS